MCMFIDYMSLMHTLQLHIPFNHLSQFSFIRYTNEYNIFNNPITVTAAASSSHQPPRSALYIGDLHPHTTDNDLHQIFSMIGSVSSVCVYKDRPSHKSPSYGYSLGELGGDGGSDVWGWYDGGATRVFSRKGTVVIVVDGNGGDGWLQ
ncbi:putative RNA recognition motif domain, nucleotide-binding alpha-beta plait domain superfamily [Helianthus anomalus]